MRLNEKWCLLRDGARPAAWNMAADEVLLELMGNGHPPVLRIYGWSDPAAVTIGYSQKSTAAPACAVRRPTGGGVVFHARDLTYSVALPYGHAVEKLDRIESYRVIHLAVAAAAAEFGIDAVLSGDTIPPHIDRATMVCFATPTRYDVMDGGAGRKIAGSAQRRAKSGLLHQGSIALNVADGDAAALSRALVAGFEKALNIKFADFAPDRKILSAMDQLCREKYQTAAWNARR